MAKRLPKDVQAALDKLEPMLADAIAAAFQNMTDAVALQQLEDAILAGDVQAALDALRITEEWFTPVHEALRAALIEGGHIAAKEMRIRDPFDGTRFVMGFDGRHTRAEQWLRDRSSNLITEVIEDQRDMARALLRDGVEAGRNPRQTALDIVGRVNRTTGKRDGGFIGLTSQQAEWAKNAEAQLRGLDRGYFSRVRRDKRYDATVAKAIKDEKPLAEADIRRIISRYRDRLLKLRADLIAENETITALRAGQMEGYQQLLDSGKIRNDQIEREWSDTGDIRTRHDHRRMRGQKIRGLDRPFTFPDGTQAMFPGDTSRGSPTKNTIRCRCWQHFRVRRDSLRYDD